MIRAAQQWHGVHVNQGVTGTVVLHRFFRFRAVHTSPPGALTPLRHDFTINKSVIHGIQGVVRILNVRPRGHVRAARLAGAAARRPWRMHMAAAAAVGATALER